MKKITFIFLFFIFFKSFSQIYIGASTPVYVKNQVLYVTQNINMAANSNLYLRNLSQLLQGTAGTSTNSGTGTISVYQEGTTDNFEYNYWCSPIGLNTSSTGNNNFGITLLNRPTTSTASTPATMLSMTTYDGTANPLAIAPYWIYKLTNANNYSQWVQVGAASTIAPGQGFTMKGTSGADATDPEGSGANNPGGTGAQRYDFRGKPNDGNIAVTVGASNAATLTGNPYPSALHLNAFLLDPLNNACTGIAYFWEQDKTTNSHLLSAYRGGYGSYSPGTVAGNGVYVPPTFNSYKQDGTVNTTGSATGTPMQRKYTPIGQGFLINGATNGTVTFRNSYRFFYKEGGTFSQFGKPAKSDQTEKNTTQDEEEIPEIPHIKINTIINNQFTRQLALAFLPEATDGIDRGIDAANMDLNIPNDVGFWLEQTNFVIQGINFDASKKIQLIAKATENTTLKFSAPIIVNFDPTQNIYIYDELDSSYHDIKNGTYEVTIAPGVYTDRFKITFTSQALGVGDVVKTNFFVMQDNKNQFLKASNLDLKNLKSFRLYDILGRIVLSKDNLGTDENYNFSTTGLSDGVYVATFITFENEKITQKIIVSNSGY